MLPQNCQEKGLKFKNSQKLTIFFFGIKIQKNKDFVETWRYTLLPWKTAENGQTSESQK